MFGEPVELGVDAREETLARLAFTVARLFEELCDFTHGPREFT
jgi:hypothetical protein